MQWRNNAAVSGNSATPATSSPLPAIGSTILDVDIHRFSDAAVIAIA